MDELISVIVPIYAVEKYLEKCIQSIRNQTYTNLEIILVDDESPDNCPLICDSYIEVDERIKVIHQKNGGLSAARNSGLEIAKGKYISFVDSDDYLYPDMYENMIEAIKVTSADICVCGIEPIYEGHFRGKLEKINIENSTYDKETFFQLISKWYYVTTVNKLYRKEIFNQLRFPVGRIHEDEFVIHKIVDKCTNIVTIPHIGYAYVQRENSIMNSKMSIKHLDLIHALINRYTFFKATGRKELAHRTAIYAYGHLMNYLEQMDIQSGLPEIRKCVIEIEKILIKDKNIRVVKLLYNYLRVCVKKRK